MPIEIVMPKLGLTMTEGTLVGWLVSEGDVIQTGKPLFEVENDKANYEITAQADGRLGRILVQSGDAIPVGQIIGYLVAEGETLPEVYSPDPIPVAAPIETPVQDRPLSPVNEGDERISRVSPAARRMAKELGVDLATVTGSGPQGRIVLEDIEAAAALAKAQPEQRTPLRGIRRTIADRMRHSLHDAAQLTLFADADVTELVKQRQALQTNAAVDGGVSYNDLFVYHVSRVLVEHPAINSRLDGDEIVQLADIHIGLAVDTARGLLVPVIRHADRKTLTEIAAARKRLLQQIEANTITPNDLTGSTFTLTNLGGFGIDGFTPILNPPECGILGFGRITPQIVVREPDDALVVRRIMTLSLTFDHRLVDGAPAARFLAHVVNRLSTPERGV